MQKMFVIHYGMLVTFVKMIYAVNSKMISMATAAILKFLSLKRLLFTFVPNLSVFVVSMAKAGILEITKPQNHLYTCHTFLLSFIQFRALSICHVFCGNGGHSEISKPQNYVYTCQTKFLESFSQFRALKIFCVFFVVSMATAAILKIPKVVCTSTHSA